MRSTEGGEFLDDYYRLLSADLRKSLPTKGAYQDALREAVARLEAVEALHTGVHKCGGDFWTDDPAYRGTIAERGLCPTRSAMRTPPGATS